VGRRGIFEKGRTREKKTKRYARTVGFSEIDRWWLGGVTKSGVFPSIKCINQRL